MPTALDQVALYPSSDDLRLPRLTLEEVVAAVSELPFESSMLVMARIQAAVWYAGADQDAHLALARGFLERRPIMADIERWARGGSHHLVFTEQHCAVLQRLLVSHARPAGVDVRLSEDQVVELIAALFSVNGLMDALLEPLGDEGEPELLLYTTRSAAYSTRANLLSDFSRAYSLFYEKARAATGNDNYLPLDDWTTADASLTLEEQFSAGFAAAASAQAFNEDTRPEARSLIAMSEALAPSGLAARRHSPTC